MDSDEFQRSDTGYLASRIVWQDGSSHRMNLAEYRDPTAVSPGHNPPIITSSFVSFLVSSRCIRQLGLPYGEMMIWYDDAEYTSRITRSFAAYEVPSSRVLHATAENSSPDFRQVIGKNPMKLRYGLRNRTFVFLNRHQGLKTKIRLLFLFVREAWILGWEEGSPLLLLRLVTWTLSGLWFRPLLQFPNPALSRPD
jgi:GT2 family glycosyltransferase